MTAIQDSYQAYASVLMVLAEGLEFPETHGNKQAYISALMVLSEGLRFTDIHGQEREQPESYVPRKEL